MVKLESVVVSENERETAETAAEQAPDGAASSKSTLDEALKGLVEDIEEEKPREPNLQWYILRVQVNREDSVRAALLRRVEVAGLQKMFGEIIVPTEDVVEFTKSGKRRVVKRKLFPGYIMIQMDVEDDDAWFLVRETPGVGDFTGGQPGKRPAPMEASEVERIVQSGVETDEGEAQVKMAIPFRSGDRVRIKEGHFENYEGEVEAIDEGNGLVTVIITIFGRSVPVKLEHWHIEAV